MFYIYTHVVYINTYMYVYRYIHMCTCIDIHICVYRYTHMYIYICACIHLWGHEKHEACSVQEIFQLARLILYTYVRLFIICMSSVGIMLHFLDIIHVCTYVCACLCVCVCTRVRVSCECYIIYVCVCSRMYICIHRYKYIQMYIYAHIYIL